MCGYLLHEWVCNHMCGYVLNVLCTHLKTRTPHVWVCLMCYVRQNSTCVGMYFMCVYVFYVCMHVHIHMWVCNHMCGYVLYMCMYLHVWVCNHMCRYVLYMCMYIHMWVCYHMMWVYHTEIPPKSTCVGMYSTCVGMYSPLRHDTTLRCPQKSTCVGMYSTHYTLKT